MLKKQETGRSMVEMLGVLAVIGVLSVAGIGGYTTAMNKHRANELLNEASKRAAIIAVQAMQGREILSIAEFPNNEALKFSTEVTHDKTNKQFTLTITGVSEEVCQQMQNAKGPTIRKFIPATCTDNATVELTYNDDMSATEKASDYNGNQSGCEADSSRQYCAGNDTCISTTDTCPPSGPTCAINPTTDCLSGALVEGECACAPAADGTECTSWTTNECGKGKYCVFSVNSCTTDPTSGTCQPVSYIGGYKSEEVAGHEYTMSDCSNCPDWWSAQSWCKAHNKMMVSLEDIHCTSEGCTDTFWQDLGNALYQYSTWTTDMYDSCGAFVVYLDTGVVDDGSRDGNVYDVLCRE